MVSDSTDTVPTIITFLAASSPLLIFHQSTFKVNSSIMYHHRRHLDQMIRFGDEIGTIRAGICVDLTDCLIV